LLRARRSEAKGGWIGAALAAAVVLALVRHNAAIVLPVAGIGLAAAVSAGVARRASVAAAPLLLWLLAALVLQRTLRVAPSHVGSEVMLLDLVALCADDRSECRELPWTADHVLGDSALEAYRPGDVSIPFWRAFATPEAAMWRERERVEAEYHEAWSRFPARLAELKLVGFARLLNADTTHLFFQPSIVANPYGLAWHDGPARFRDALVGFATRVADNRAARWVSGVHLVWLLLDVVWLASLLVAYRRKRDGRFIFLAVVLALPLAYTLSFLAASPVRDYRFLYPLTLFTQTVTLASVLRGRLDRRHQGGGQLADQPRLPDSKPLT
jgi:hypothetical protein